MANNEKILCWLRKTWLSLWILGSIAGLLITVGVVYARINGQVSDNKTMAEKATQKADANEKTIIRMDTKLDYIIGSIEELKNARK